MHKLYPKELEQLQTHSQVYDPFRIPPNQDLILAHVAAKQVGRVNFARHQVPPPLCPCCNLPIQKDQLSLCVPFKDLAFLGFGFPLFFQAMHHYIYLLIATFALVGIYNIKTTADLCYPGYSFSWLDAKTDCYHFIGIAYTTLKSDEQLIIQSVLCLCGTILLGTGLYLIKLFQFQRQKRVEKTPSDFTLIMRNVPTHSSKEEIAAYFRVHFGNDNIVKVTHIVAFEEFLNLKNQKVQLLCEQRRVFARLQSPSEIEEKQNQLGQVMREIQVLDEKLATFQNQLNQDELPLRTGYVLVTFKEDFDTSKILSACQGTFLEAVLDDIDCCENIEGTGWQNLGGNRIVINRAPEPLDMQWANFAVSHSSKRLRRLLSIFLSFLWVGGGAIAVYGISYTQNEARKSGEQRFYLNYILSGLCSLVIQVVNMTLEWLVKKTATYEKHNTFTHEIRNIVLTQTIMQFINTALVPFGLFIFTDFDQNNLAASLFFIFMGNAIFLPIFEIVDPYYLHQKYLRRRIQQDTFRTEFTQQQAHEIYEGPDYRIADKYSSIHKNVFICVFYMCMFPYGSIFQVISIFFFYWCAKLTLLRRCAYPSNLSIELHESIYTIMTFLPIVLAVGGVCYEFVLVDRRVNLIIHIFNLILAAIITIVLQKAQVGSRKGEEKKLDKIYCYEDVKKEFQTDYDKCNPATKDLAHFEWRQFWKRSI